MTSDCELYADGLEKQALIESVDAILADTELCSVATSDRGAPYIHTVYFAYSDNLTIYFLSPPSAQHSINITTTPAVAISVFNGTQTYGAELQGLQIFGDCTLSEGTLAEQAFAVYAARFPKICSRFPSFDHYQLAVSESRLYQIQAQRIKIFDEPRFGKRTWITATVVNQTMSLGTKL